MIAHFGYFAWNVGSSYSDARTAGSPPSTDVYRWFSTLRKQRIASHASARCWLVLATARLSPPSVTLADSPGRTPGYGANPKTFLLASYAALNCSSVGENVPASLMLPARSDCLSSGRKLTPPLTAFSSIDGRTNGQFTSSGALPCSSASRAVPSSVWVIDGSAPGAVATSFMTCSALTVAARCSGVSVSVTVLPSSEST